MNRLFAQFNTLVGRFRLRLIPMLAAAGVKDEYVLLFLSLVVGAATGVGAHLFYRILEWCYHHTQTPQGILASETTMLILLPMAGALLVGIITERFAREAKGHGVPEVMDATYRQGGVIRPRVSVAKAIASALTIGSGGSAGTEGPIVQIGAAISSTAGQSLGIHKRHMNTLIGCGVAGGIAAIFNAPIAGVLFALEIFLRDFSFKTFSPIVFASVISTSLTHYLRPSDRGIFEVARPEHYVFNGIELPYYLLLGIFCAFAALAFVRLLYAVEDLFDRIPINPIFKPVIGAALLGVLGITWVLVVHDATIPSFYGNGYPLIETAIGPGLLQLSFKLLLALCIVKILATVFTLGSGGSGGIFAPSLFIGACVGGAFGIGLHKLGFIPEASASAYAIVGMAAVVAATTHAPLTAIVILYELTRQPRVILPIMFAAIVAMGIARALFRESIYTLKLTRRGVRVGRLADLTILKSVTADQVRVIPAPVVHPEDPLQKLLDMAEDTEAADFVVTDDQGDYFGMVVGDDIKTALLQPEAVPLLLVNELVRVRVPTVGPTESLDSVLDKFARSHVASLPLTAPGDEHRIDGLITRQAVMDRYQAELETRG